MPKFAHSDVLDGGLLAIKNNVTKMLLISGYTAGDSYATVVAAQLAAVAMTPADFTVGAAAGNGRNIVSAAGKSAAATASAAGTPDLHIAFTDGAAKVLWVTDETTNQPITSGNTVDFPVLTYNSAQPI